MSSPPSPIAIRQELLHFLAELLQVPTSSIDPEARLIDLGADSIMLASAVDWLQRRFNLHIPMDRFFGDLATVSSLAAHLESLPALGGVQLNAEASAVDERVLELMLAQLATVRDLVTQQNELIAASAVAMAQATSSLGRAS